MTIAALYPTLIKGLASPESKDNGDADDWSLHPQSNTKKKLATGQLDLQSKNKKSKSQKQKEMISYSSFSHQSIQTNNLLDRQHILDALQNEGRVVLSDLNFGVESSRLNGIQAVSLEHLADIMRADPGLRLIVEGHTDHLGREDRNRRLSLERARSVQQVLVSKFQIDADRIGVRGRGSAHPIADTSHEGRRLNRRVEIKLAEQR